MAARLEQAQMFRMTCPLGADTSQRHAICMIVHLPEEQHAPRLCTAMMQQCSSKIDCPKSDFFVPPLFHG